MKVKSTIVLCVTVVLVIAIGLLAVNGVKIGKYRFITIPEAVHRGLDLNGGAYGVFQADASVEDFAAKRAATVDILRSRIEAQGFTDAAVALLGDDQIHVEMSGASSPAAVAEALSAPGEFALVDGEGNAVIDGTHVKTAQSGYDSTYGIPLVALTLTEDGAEKLRTATEEHAGEAFEFQIDGQAVSSFTANEPITNGMVAITNLQYVQEARIIENIIVQGALPLTLTVRDASTITATLGLGVNSAALIACVVGILLAALYMVIMYRLTGLIAGLALIFNLLITFYTLALLPAAMLTLSGIVGILFGVCMTLAMNMLIFERFRGEVKSARSLTVAFDRGFKSAIATVLDLHVILFVIGLSFLYLGTGSVAGFGTTLLITAFASILSIYLTRFLFRHVVRLTPENNALYTR